MGMTAVEIFGVGGPVAGVAALLGFLLKAYLEKRGADRDDVKLDRESESGIVETTRQALALAREEMSAIDERRRREREELELQITRLRQENDRLTKALVQARNRNDGNSGFPTRQSRPSHES